MTYLRHEGSSVKVNELFLEISCSFYSWKRHFEL